MTELADIHCYRQFSNSELVKQQELFGPMVEQQLLATFQAEYILCVCAVSGPYREDISKAQLCAGSNSVQTELPEETGRQTRPANTTGGPSTGEPTALKIPPFLPQTWYVPVQDLEKCYFYNKYFNLGPLILNMFSDMSSHNLINS